MFWRIRLWWHCLLGMFKGHQRFEVNYEFAGNPVRLVGCTCGRMFCYAPWFEGSSGEITFLGKNDKLQTVKFYCGKQLVKVREITLADLEKAASINSGRPFRDN